MAELAIPSLVTDLGGMRRRWRGIWELPILIA
jgi:hypothetical protein